MSTARPRGRPRDDQRHEARHEEILSAAARLFAKHGYAGLDLEVLAEELGIGKGTIYRHFSTKSDLFLAAVDHGMKRLDAVIEAAKPECDPLDGAELAVAAYLRFFRDHPEYVELLMLERAEFRDRQPPTYFAHWERNQPKWEAQFRVLIEAGRVRDLPIPTLMRVFSDMVYGTMSTNFYTGRSQNLEQQAREIIDVVFNGILTDAERHRRATRRSPA
jgi:AcrR family transcriptional regulator